MFGRINIYILINLYINICIICVVTANLDSGLNPSEKEELQVALIAAQESSIIQVLLEICLAFYHDTTVSFSIKFK